MSRFQSAFCRSAPWRTFARRAVLPWALQGFRPEGDVLEIGAGSGAMAAELLTMYPEVRLTVTDFDDEMVEAASARLSQFGDRVNPASDPRQRMIHLPELRVALRDLPVDQSVLTPSLAGFIVRFTLQKASEP